MDDEANPSASGRADGVAPAEPPTATTERGAADVASPDEADRGGDDDARDRDDRDEDESGQFGAVLRSPFKWVLYASLASSLGDWIGFAAITAFTTSIEGSGRAGAFALSVVLAARFLPTVLLGPIAGVFADRWDRRRLLILTDLGRAAVMVALPFATDVWALILATLVVEVLATMFIPVKDAIIPNLVPRGRLVQANQLSLLSTYGTFPVGFFGYAMIVSVVAVLPDIALLQERPEVLAFWFNALTFLASAWFVSRIPGISGRAQQRLEGREHRPGAVEELREGLRFIAGQPLVRALITGVMGAALGAGSVIAVGEFYAGIVRAGPNGFGLLAGIVGTGLFLGIVATTWLEPRLGKERLFAPAIGLAGGALIVTAMMPRLDWAIVPALLMGAGGGIALLAGYTMLQEYSADEIRGRTFAAFNTGVRTALFATTALAPLLVAIIGPEERFGDYQVGGVRITLVLAGLLALAGAVYSGRAVHRALSITGGLSPTDRRTRGLFVVFEGGDGAGKSTQMRLLAEALGDLDLDPIMTREPGGTALGERLRQIVLDPAESSMSDRTEAMVYAAARAQHVAEVISPALDDGRVVLSDRYVDSSIVYQGVGRGLGSEEVARLNRWATNGVQPDLVVLLDVPADEGITRAGTSLDRLESAGLDFHLRVNEAFRRLAAMTPSRYLVVNATLPVEDLHQRIRATVLRRLDPGALDVDAASREAVEEARVEALGLDADTGSRSGDEGEDDVTVEVDPAEVDEERTEAPDDDATVPADATDHDGVGDPAAAAELDEALADGEFDPEQLRDDAAIPGRPPPGGRS